ncbi:MAG: GspH/FimT family pseudopilin [Candidatus Accumulibacter sp.]|nr:GspH/FimT family pseudopilin [Accumulibacter sp.]
MGNFHDVLGHQQGRRLLKSLRGFSLIELIVGMAILGILTSLAIPAFSEWLRNARVRTTTESVQNGLQLARAEAVRRNSVMRFSLVTTTDASCALATAGPNWVVSIDDPAGQCDVAPSDTVAPRIVQLRSAAEGGAATTVAAGASAFIFNSLGRRTLPLPAAGNVAIDFSSTTGGTCAAAGGTVRCLRVVISVGGQIRMCDPALPAGDAQAC